LACDNREERHLGKEQGRKWRGASHLVARAHDTHVRGLYDIKALAEAQHQWILHRDYAQALFFNNVLVMFSSQCGFQVLQWHAKIVGYSCIENCVVLCGVDYENDRICGHAILRGLYNTSWTHFLPMPIAPCSTPSPYVFGECDSSYMEE
jgi:hypothetical protein